MNSPRQITQTSKGYVIVGSKKGSEVIALVDKNKDGSSDYISLDRNGNQKIDAVIEIITVSDKNLSYRWFIDDNEDGVVELIANDADGDWIIEDIYPF